MLFKILGFFWILYGFIWFLKPNMLRGRIGKKTVRKIHWTFFGFLLFLIINLSALVMSLDWVWPRLIGFLLLLLVIKVAWMLESRLVNSYRERLSEIPLYWFRVFAAVCLATGAWLIMV